MNGREVNRSIKKSQNYCQYGFFRTLKKYTRTNKLATPLLRMIEYAY